MLLCHCVLRSRIIHHAIMFLCAATPAKSFQDIFSTDTAEHGGKEIVKLIALKASAAITPARPPSACYTAVR
jgi:hypothetical protein